VGNNEVHRRIRDFELEGCRIVGRPKLRWMDGWCGARSEEVGDPKMVDGRQDQGSTLIRG